MATSDDKIMSMLAVLSSDFRRREGSLNDRLLRFSVGTFCVKAASVLK